MWLEWIDVGRGVQNWNGWNHGKPSGESSLFVFIDLILTSNLVISKLNWNQPYTTGKRLIAAMSLVKKKKVVTDNRYIWRAQKNMSRVGRDLVSTTPNDGTRNKNASLEVRLRVLLGSEKRPWQRSICTHHGFKVYNWHKKLTVCCWFFHKISDPTHLSIVGACRHTCDEPLVLYIVGFCRLLVTFVL
jgi:hypothetical protein